MLMANNIPCKVVGLNVYYHQLAVDTLDPALIARISKARQIANLTDCDQYCVIKFSEPNDLITFLDYPGFVDEAFPTLKQHWTIDLRNSTCRYRNYEDSLNPPILHRKELLLPQNHPRREEFQSLTAAAEQVGLFDNPIRIGFKRAWEALLAQRGYKVVAHDLVPIGNDESSEIDESISAADGVARHLTALTRYGFSAPLQALARFGFLDGAKSIFDYGCGRGDDLKGLRQNNIRADGWDPYFAPNCEKKSADIVNLGFVINVIEDSEERSDALRGAYHLTDELLVVSAMLANQESVSGTPYSDGVLTSRNTFQKYYTQGELRHFIDEVTGEEPIPVGPGIFFLFKDKDAEQRFMYGRTANRRNVLRLSHLSRSTKPVPVRISRADAKYEGHKELIEYLWETLLILGRDPDKSEVANLSGVIEAFGSLGVALRFIKSRKSNADAMLNEARQARVDDLVVYFAQLQFEKRKPYSHLEPRLQRDVRTFFGDLRSASQVGRDLLYSVAQIEAIGNACHQAAEEGLGWLEDSDSLQIHTGLVGQLPPVLRAYVHCGTHLYGDVTSADLIKIHIRSRKLTLMTFDDFEGKALPKLLQRVKLNLRTQDLNIFDYTSSFEPPYLYRKSRFINEEFQNYAEQVAFEESLDEAKLMEFTGYGPSVAEFDRILEKRRYAVDGFQLIRSPSIPCIDSFCGRYFTYRQLIECGETQAKTGLANLPLEPDSYTA